MVSGTRRAQEVVWSWTGPSLAAAAQAWGFPQQKGLRAKEFYGTNTVQLNLQLYVSMSARTLSGVILVWRVVTVT